ncbi:MAG: farnesyl diphosphate synthase [Pseudomonadota bacterium]
MKSELTQLIALCQSRTENLFTEYLKEPVAAAPLLQEAITYAVFNGGKRIRPLLVYATGLALGTPLENLDPAAAAVELMHAYSLVHDDLPAMDNADTRRGKPSCHKVYGEAVAILAGDALQSLAFQVIIAQPAQILPHQRLKMLGILSEASGLNGMAGGQALDMAAGSNNLVDLLNLYRLKTGALLLASVQMGMVSAEITDAGLAAGLTKYAECVGLGFQLRDDLLDIESSSAVSGKPQGLDVVNSKMTYPLLVGVEKTRLKIGELHEEALAGIAGLGKDGAMLREISGYLLSRVS